MTAGLAVGLHRALDTSEILQLAAAAGAANVVRRRLEMLMPIWLLR